MTKTAHLFRATCSLSAALLLFTLTTLANPTAYYPPTPSPDAATAVAEEPAPVVAVAAVTPEAYRFEADPQSPPGARPVYDELTVNERREAGLPTSRPAVMPYYGRRTVYLTFDDGPDPDVTPKILQILHNENIKATFFVVGNQVEKAPELLRQIHDAGHAVGNHSYNHVYRDLYRSPAAYTAQLNRTDYIIKSIIGVRPLISRAPGGSAGSFTPEYWAALKSQGYAEVGWNIYGGDASQSQASELVAAVAAQVADRPYLWSHAIVLLHDGRGHAETAKALPAIIKIFKDRGFEFRVVNLETPPAW